MTEDEAKTKWCPFIKGENGEGESRATCVASACMAWRWTSEGMRLDFDDNGPLLRPRGAAGPEGGCGLAGAPQ